MIVREDQWVQRTDAEAIDNEAHECRMVELPIGSVTKRRVVRS